MDRSVGQAPQQLVRDPDGVETHRLGAEGQLADLDLSLLRGGVTLHGLEVHVDELPPPAAEGGPAPEAKPPLFAARRVWAQISWLALARKTIAIEEFEFEGFALRLDRLKVEGFVSSREITGSLRGAAVRVRGVLGDDEKAVIVKGKIVFISSEIDPVNAQVRVWAEVENPDLLLRPGLPAEMVIDSANRTATNTSAPAKTIGER